MIHRGPDDEGYHIGPSIGLGMRRLSIIDIEGGTQPIYNEDSSICVIHNGEIYNYKELRRDLTAKGHRFRTHSDTEVIVHLYEQYGDSFVDHLFGMYAIAVWDASTRRLVLVRDRLGQKPLYYARLDGSSTGLVFASELKCLEQSGLIDRQLNPVAVYHYFSLGYVPHPHTIYVDVQHLPPGTILAFENGKTTTRRYWRPLPANDIAPTIDDASQQIKDLLGDATRMRLRSDVPVGAFLSGGLDSSITVALMADHGSSDIDTFHIDYDDPKASESRFAEQVSSYFGTRHHSLVISASSPDYLDDLIAQFDEPFADSSAIPTFEVCRLARRHVTVAMAGDGADEAFGGYARHLRIARRRSVPRSLRTLADLTGRVFYGLSPACFPARRHIRCMGMDNITYYASGLQEIHTREILQDDFIRHNIGDLSTVFLLTSEAASGAQESLQTYSLIDIGHYLPDDILTKVDRMSMANSLEVRSPFLDHRIIEFAIGIPENWKIRQSQSKRILRKAFGNILPPEILLPRKRGFTPPLQKWLRCELKETLRESLYDDRIGQSGVVRLKTLQQMADEHWSNRRDWTDQLWRYLVFARWWNNHMSSNFRRVVLQNVVHTR